MYAETLCLLRLCLQPKEHSKWCSVCSAWYCVCLSLQKKMPFSCDRCTSLFWVLDFCVVSYLLSCVLFYVRSETFRTEKKNLQPRILHLIQTTHCKVTMHIAHSQQHKDDWISLLCPNICVSCYQNCGLSRFRPQLGCRIIICFSIGYRVRRSKSYGC